MFQLVVSLHLFSTVAMVGLIWFVQLVHYPLFASVGREQFQAYEAAHKQRTTWVVAPLMLIEAATAVLLLGVEDLPRSAVWTGLGLLATVWLSTFFWQVPAHEKLSQGFDSRIHRRLVSSNWLRTVCWTARGVLACWMCLLAFY